MGSGTATLNAICFLAEQLSASSGFTTIDPQILSNSPSPSSSSPRLLIIHAGSRHQRLPSGCNIRGKAFSSLPLSIDPEDPRTTSKQHVIEPAAIVDLLLVALDKLDIPPGLFCASTESILLLPEKVGKPYSFLSSFPSSSSSYSSPSPRFSSFPLPPLPSPSILTFSSLPFEHSSG
jgi:hypothetical protein